MGKRESPAEIDWDATLAFRRQVYSWGLGVADAMDTAQRNTGLDAAATRELITRSAEVAADEHGALVVGVSTDHLDEETVSLDRAVDAYESQLHFAEDRGAAPVLMASRHVARAARSAENYRRVYREVIASAGAPVVLHWLGAAFDPELAGYFGSHDWREAGTTLLQIIAEHPGRIAGVKMSLLDAASEVWVRERLAEGVRMFSGDDYNYVGLIGGRDVPEADQPAGDPRSSRGHSDALLGAFAAITPLASQAIQALDAADTRRYLEVLGPTERLSRHVFAAPTFFYKTGIAFLSWLNGHQRAFQMVGGLHAARSLPHLSGIVEFANAAGALERPELALETRTGARGARRTRAARPGGRGDAGRRAVASHVRLRSRRRVHPRAGAGAMRGPPRRHRRGRRRRVPRLLGSRSARPGRAGRSEGRIATYQVCDWKTPLAADVLLSRHYPGEGIIDLRTLTRAVEHSGYDGDVEVEIFHADVWNTAPHDAARRVVDTFGQSVAPHLGVTARL